MELADSSWNFFCKRNPARGNFHKSMVTKRRSFPRSTFLRQIFRGLPLLLIVAGPSAYAAGDAAPDLTSGQNRFTACAACHGADGQQTTSPRYPKIGGQNAAYLVAALTAYRDGQRTGTEASLMGAMAKPLSNADISSLAAYISTMRAR
jgi:cytochrome c553